MACGCGGTNGGSGGCGGDKPLANPLLETELAHELPQAAASAVVEFDPAPAAPGADAEPLLIASSEQDWPRIRVNGVLIEPEAMALELQYHPAAEQSEAMFLAAQALVIRASISSGAHSSRICRAASSGALTKRGRLLA